MGKTVTINGKVFTLLKEVGNFREHVNNSGRYTNRYLGDCYAKPSTTKWAIYNNWLNWVIATHQGEAWQYDPKMGVASYNSNIFTLDITLFYENEWYYIHVTPTKQWAQKLFVG